MIPPLAKVAAAHQRYLIMIADLTDAQITAPSRLPGWTRGHVLAHVTDAARARANVIEHGLRGEQVDMWLPGERDLIIDATAGRSAEQHREAFAESAAKLEHAWSTVRSWDAYESTVFTRWRELQIHLVDLDVGIERAEWDAAFVTHVVDLFSQRLPKGYALQATDLGQQWGDGTAIVGSGRDLAAWLLGRESPVTGPQLGPWPSY